MKAIRLLKASEIECRVGTINEKGLSILLFKDARVDQKLLDESFTPMGWKWIIMPKERALPSDKGEIPGRRRVTITIT